MISDFFDSKENSTGSSIVIICFLKFVFIKSIIPARLVDFPLPVGPVIKISHFDFEHIVFTISPSQSCSSVGISLGIILIAIE